MCVCVYGFELGIGLTRIPGSAGICPSARATYSRRDWLAPQQNLYV